MAALEEQTEVPLHTTNCPVSFLARFIHKPSHLLVSQKMGVKGTSPALHHPMALFHRLHVDGGDVDITPRLKRADFILVAVQLRRGLNESQWSSDRPALRGIR